MLKIVMPDNRIARILIRGRNMQATLLNPWGQWVKKENMHVLSSKKSGSNDRSIISLSDTFAFTKALFELVRTCRTYEFGNKACVIRQFES